MKWRKEFMAKSSLNFRYSDFDKSPNNKIKMRLQKYTKEQMGPYLMSLLKTTNLTKVVNLKKMLLYLTSLFQKFISGLN